MPKSTPPRGERPLSDADVVDSGWSTAPPARVVTEPDGAGAQSGLQRLPSNHRAEGTLLGVAPPRSPASAPSRGNPVVVHAGVSKEAPLKAAVSAAPTNE